MNALQELAVDTGVLIEFLCGTPLGLKFGEKVAKSDVLLYITETTVLLDSVEVVETKEMQILAGEYKCKRSISLSDCFTIAAAKITGVPALFKKEQELSKEIKKRSSTSRYFY